MRFLIGIFTGAVVTLLVATAMDAPTDPILNNARDLAASSWDRLINATSSSLFEPVNEITVEERASTGASEANNSTVGPAKEQGERPVEASSQYAEPVPGAEPLNEANRDTYAALKDI